MSIKLDQDQLNALVAAVIQQLKTQPAAPAPSQPKAGTDLAPKDRYLLAAFKRKGIENVVLMNRTDRSKPFNVRPYGNAEKGTGWIGQGRIVKKGETSVRGLFHVSQTEPLPQPKPATPAPAPKAAKAKPKLTPVS